MSDPTPTDHTFISPGQAAPDFPPPDECVRCGRPAAEHQAGHAGYYAAVTAEDERLQQTLAAISADMDAGELTVVEAAGNRVAALETHLARCQDARRRFLGHEHDDTEGTGPACPRCGERLDVPGYCAHCQEVTP